MVIRNEITREEFFGMFNEDERDLTLGLLQLAHVPVDQKRLSFDEFLLCVCLFAPLTQPELCKYVFDLLDEDHSGM